jgi:hypothetical protein
MQHGQVFELKRRSVDGGPVWAYRYRTGGPGSRRLQRGGFSCERDAAEALERALEHLRRQNGVGSTLTLKELVEETSPSMTRNRRRSQSSAGCSPRRYGSLAAAALPSCARRRSRPGG